MAGIELVLLLYYLYCYIIYRVVFNHKLSNNTIKMKITFDKTLSTTILKAFNKKVDQGYILDQTTNSRVLSQDGDEIKLSDFAGILPGSEIFIKSDIISLIKYLDWDKENAEKLV